MNVCVLPPSEKKETLVVISHSLWILTGVILALAAGAALSGLLENPPGDEWLEWEPPLVLRGLTFFISRAVTEAG